MVTSMIDTVNEDHAVIRDELPQMAKEFGLVDWEPQDVMARFGEVNGINEAPQDVFNSAQQPLAVNSFRHFIPVLRGSPGVTWGGDECRSVVSDPGDMCQTMEMGCDCDWRPFRPCHPPLRR